MRCEAHPSADAVGICKTCGRGTCVECKVIFSGVLHCKVCVAAGRASALASTAQVVTPTPSLPPLPPARPPPRQLRKPEPQGKPSAAFFNLGEAGAVAAGSLCLFNAAAFPLIGLSSGAPKTALAALAVALLIAEVPFAAGIHGMHRNWGAKWARDGAVALVACSLLFPVLLALGYSYRGLGPDPANIVTLNLAFISMASGLVIAGLAVRQGAPYHPDERTALESGAMLGVGGAMLGLFSLFAAGSALCTPPGWIILGAGHFMTRRFFRDAPVPGVVR